MMKQEQIDRLMKRADELTEVFLDESDPAAWPGNGVAVAEMNSQTRGDRYWCKKNAVASLTVVQRILAVIEQLHKKDNEGKGNAKDGDDLEQETKAAEKEAEKLLKDIQHGSRAKRKKEFDKRVHGTA